MTARRLFWKKVYVLSDLILGMERPYVARMATLTPWLSICGSRRLLRKGPVEKMAFFDTSGLYALNPQQEALNCIIFIFSDL